MKKQKKAMFLSIEMTIILVVLSALAILVAISVIRIRQTGLMGRVIREYSSYSDAISAFYQLYRYWPGDLPIQDMVGELNDIQTRNTLNNNPRFNGATLGSRSIPNAFNFAFRQLVFSKLISNTKGVDMACDFSSNQDLIATPVICPTRVHANFGFDTAFQQGYTNLFPYSTFDRQSTWVFLKYTSKIPCSANNSAINNNKGLNLIDGLCNQNNAGLRNAWQDQPRLILTKLYIDDNNLFSVQEAMHRSPNMAPVFAELIDRKIDDGMPLSPQGYVVAQGTGHTTSGFEFNTCSDYYSTNPNKSTIQQGVNAPLYLPNGPTVQKRLDDGALRTVSGNDNNGCYLTFMIRG